MDKKLKKIILQEMHMMGLNPYKMGLPIKNIVLKKQEEPEYEGQMAKEHLFKIAKYATELHNMLEDDENLEPWVQDKITIASHNISAIMHHLEYKKLSGD